MIGRRSNLLLPLNQKNHDTYVGLEGVLKFSVPTQLERLKLKTLEQPKRRFMVTIYQMLQILITITSNTAKPQKVVNQKFWAHLKT